MPHVHFIMLLLDALLLRLSAYYYSCHSNPLLWKQSVFKSLWTALLSFLIALCIYNLYFDLTNIISYMKQTENEIRDVRRQRNFLSFFLSYSLTRLLTHKHLLTHSASLSPMQLPWGSWENPVRQGCCFGLQRNEPCVFWHWNPKPQSWLRAAHSSISEETEQSRC